MKAAVYYGREDIRTVDVPAPRMSDGEAIIEVKSVGVCPTDVKAYYNGSGSISAPLTLGHEVSGVVVESLAENLHVGDRVNVAADCPCLECSRCRRGLHNLCSDLKSLGVNVNGSYAEKMLVPASYIRRDLVFRLGRSTTFDEGALIEPVAVSLHCLSLAGRLCRKALVIGDGPNALIHMQLLKRVMKSAVVTVLGLSEERLETAKKLGADEVIDARTYTQGLQRTSGDDFDVIDVTIGNRDAMKEAIEMAGYGTAILIFGGSVSDSDIPLSMNQVHYRQLAVTGSTGTNLENYSRAVDIVNSGILDLKSMMTSIFLLAQVTSALEYSRNMKGLKCMVHPDANY